MTSRHINSQIIAGLVDTCLAAAYGVRVRLQAGFAERFRQLFYSWRADLPQPLPKQISLFLDPEDPQSTVLLVHTMPSERTTSDAEAQE